MKLQSLIAEGQTLSDATGRPRSGVQLVRPAKLYPRHDWQPFELKTALVPSSENPPEPTTATAYPLVWNDDEDELVRDETSDFPVWDLLGTRRGRAYDAEYSVTGTRGLARKIGHRWVIVVMQPNALMIRGLLTAALATTDTTFTIDGVTVMNPTGGIITDQDPAGNVIIQNIFSWEGDDNGKCLAAWNENTDKWDAAQVECPS